MRKRISLPYHASVSKLEIIICRCPGFIFSLNDPSSRVARLFDAPRKLVHAYAKRDAIGVDTGVGAASYLDAAVMRATRGRRVVTIT